MVTLPVGVMAATGAFVNITDPVNGAYRARVNSVGAQWTTDVDPVTKSQARIVVNAALWAGTDGSCTTLGAELKDVLVYHYLQVEQLVSLTFSTPIVATGSPVCLVLGPGGSYPGMIFGYQVNGFIA